MNSVLTMFWFLWCFLVAYWAARWNRSFWGYFVACFFLSPLLTAIVLAIEGRNKLAPRQAVR